MSRDVEPPRAAPGPTFGRRGKRLLLLISAGAVLLRIGYMCGCLPADELVSLDARGYHRLAAQMVRGEGYRSWGLWLSRPGEPESMSPPGYPLFVAAIYLVFGIGNFTAVRLAQAALAGLGTYWVALAAWRLTKRPSDAIWTAAVQAAYPLLIPFAGDLLTEAVCWVLLAGVFVLLTGGEAGPGRSFGLGLLCGGLAMVRPASLVLYPAWLLLWLRDSCARRRWPQAAATWALFHLALAAVMGPWLVRNQRLLGAPVLSTTGSYVAFLGNSTYYLDQFGLGRVALFDRPVAAIQAVKQAREHPTAIEREAELRGLLLDGIRRRPFSFTTASAYRLARYLSPTLSDAYPPWMRLVAFATYGPLLVGFLLWPWCSGPVEPRAKAVYAALLVAVASHALVHAVAWGEVRLRLSFTDPVLILFGSGVVGRWLTRPWRRPVARENVGG